MISLSSVIRRVRLKPLKAAPYMHIERFEGQPDRFRITGADPQMLLLKGRRELQLKAGAYELIVIIDSATSRLVSPKLYVDAGDGFNEAHGSVFYFTQRNPGVWSVLFRIERPAVRLRLDPSDSASGTFTIKHLTVTRTKTTTSAGHRLSVDRDIFCAAPFIQSLVTTGGEMRPCPVFLADRSRDVRWNSAEMQSVRQQMIGSVRPRQCRTCLARENDGATSVRQIINRAWETFRWGNPNGESLESLAESVTPDFSIQGGPKWVELNLGNLCNLSCRMCSPASSSRVARDPVQSRFFGPGDHVQANVQRMRWARNPNTLGDIIGSDLSAATKLELKGGEPLLIKSVSEVLNQLIDSRRNKDVDLVIVTSAAVLPQSTLVLLEKFHLVSFIISMDGVGPLNDYIRHGSTWDAVVQNLALIRAMDNSEVSIASTIQAYNMFHLVEIAEFALGQGLPLSCNMLRDPVHLSCFTMPHEARQEAALRIRRFLAGLRTSGAGLVPISETLSGVADSLENEDHPEDEAALDKFLAYTAALDCSRGQSMAICNGELSAYLTGRS